MPVGDERACYVCGKSFLSKADNQRTCSDPACKRQMVIDTRENDLKRRKLIRSEFKKNRRDGFCCVCGKEFISKVVAYTCSAACRHKYHGGMDRLIKRCVICGEQYRPTQSRQQTCGKKYCKTRLKMRSNARRNKAKQAAKRRNCKVCGASFKPFRNSVFCSDTCREVDMVERQIEYGGGPQIKQCVVCGENFSCGPGTGIRSNTILCSPVCKRYRYNQRQKSKHSDIKARENYAAQNKRNQELNQIRRFVNEHSGNSV